MPAFIPGIELSRRFYVEGVQPVLQRFYPDLRHAAAHVGSGSDVLGYDTEMSTDHFWGPKVRLFVSESDFHLKAEIEARMSENLPFEVAGYPVHYDNSRSEDGMDIMTLKTEYPLKHHVWVTTVSHFTRQYLNWTPDQDLTPADWLSFPQQKLLEVTAGSVHFDDLGELTAMRERLRWYPRDVWLFIMACGWARIGQEEHLMPRAGHAGDELGSAIMGSRLVRDVMSLCFLMEQKYAPYPKWFGTAFKRLDCAREFLPPLWRAQLTQTWRERERAIGTCFAALARKHNQLGLTDPLPEETSNFFGRPFKVIHGERFVEALMAQITDPAVKAIPSLIGSVDQFSDSTDMRENIQQRPIIRQLYQP